MKKISEKLAFLLIIISVFFTLVDFSVFIESDFSLSASAEEDVTVEDIEKIVKAVPRHLNYFNEDTVNSLNNILEYINNDDLNECSEEELSNYYNMAESAIKNLTYKTAEIPQVYISTAEQNGNSIVKEDGYVDTSIAVVDTDGTLIHDDKGLIKVRGNSTSLAPKKPYAVKFNKKQNILGMGKAKKWVLLANCFDPTLLRNYIAFDFAAHLNLEYTSEQRFVELWVDGIFKGCYLLMEPVEAGKTRVDIDTEKNSRDFIIEFDRRGDPDNVSISALGYNIVIKEPEEPSESQIKFINHTVEKIAESIKKCNYNEIKKLIDIESFAKYYLLNEFLKTVDFDFSSIFYYYKDGMLYAGPVWDYDLSSGNENADLGSLYKSAGQSEGLYANMCQFFKYLTKCEEFNAEVAKIFEKNQDYIRSIYYEKGLIDHIVNENNSAINRNFSDAGWIISGKYSDSMRLPGSDYEKNLNYLKKWLSERFEWLCDYWKIEKRYNINNIFKDEIFRNYIFYEFDINKDGYLSEYEIVNINRIDVSGMGVSDLSGIEYIIYLRELDCHNNNITKLNLVKNTILKKLNCSENKIRYLDVGNNKLLTDLDCSSNCLSYIDLKNCTLLRPENFNCSGNVYELKCGEHDSYFEFSSITGINPKKIKELKGADYIKGTAYEMSDQIVYKYLTGLVDAVFYINVESHDYGESVLKSEATCAENEVYIRFCKNCGAAEETVKENTTVPHKLVQKDPKEPDCTNRGKKMYWKCVVCKEKFSDPEGTSEICEPEYISPLGHDWKYYLNDDKDEIIAECKRDGNHTASVKIIAENAVYNGEKHKVALFYSTNWTEEGCAEPYVIYEGDLVNSGTVNAYIIVGEGETEVITSVTYVISYMKGDITGNGKIDLYDAIEIAKSIIGVRIFNDEEYGTSDFNGDGIVNLYDVIRIAEYLLED